ncbi:hypothetical protein AVEN_257431-1 [Araneus ventricosus]|uniref:Uncharacterized protein n=1 Tax=Araneus ventricosus TaxID=182803 RepID=A0A4Y2FEH9_ARAVE|nr:hypothetical protein AVEN_257431-1 [Araneus ventricosus]
MTDTIWDCENSPSIGSNTNAYNGWIQEDKHFPLKLKDIFTNADFMPLYVTVRLDPAFLSESAVVTTAGLLPVSTSPLPEPSGINQSSNKTLEENDFPSSLDVKPFLKAEPKKNLQR